MIINLEVEVLLREIVQRLYALLEKYFRFLNALRMYIRLHLISTTRKGGLQCASAVIRFICAIRTRTNFVGINADPHPMFRSARRSFRRIIGLSS